MSPLRISPLAGLLSAALLLTGCFNEADKIPENSGDARLRLAMLQPPRSGLTPLSDDAFKLSRWSTAETLVVLDKLGEAQPALATKWQQTGENSWRFELRPDVKFHDGTALDAATVVNALTVAAHAAPKPRILDGVADRRCRRRTGGCRHHGAAGSAAAAAFIQPATGGVIAKSLQRQRRGRSASHRLRPVRTGAG